MRFGSSTSGDASGRPPAQQIAERLELVEAYERLGYRVDGARPRRSGPAAAGHHAIRRRRRDEQGGDGDRQPRVRAV